MKLYHVSYDPIPMLKPRVPDHRLPDEDCSTPRICLSDTIENCVNAKPGQATPLYLAEQFGLRVPLYVYEFDTEDIPYGALLEPKELTHSGKVSDAEYNHEYWLLDAESHTWKPDLNFSEVVFSHQRSLGTTQQLCD